jgi:hypothetical protein
MNENITAVKFGLFFVMLTLIFGIGMGVIFGAAESRVHSYISQGISANEELHDEFSQKKIWRFAQRSHFHATGIAAFSIGLVLLIMFSSLKKSLKSTASFLVGLGGLYPLSWFSMFLLAPSLGRKAAHNHIVTEILVYVGVGGLLLGIAILCANLFLGMFREA